MSLNPNNSKTRADGRGWAVASVPTVVHHRHSRGGSRRDCPALHCPLVAAASAPTSCKGVHSSWSSR